MISLHLGRREKRFSNGTMGVFGKGEGGRLC